MRPSRKIETSMREDMFRHLESLSSSYFNKIKTGDLMALLINDLGAIRMASGMALIGLFDALFLSSMSLLFMMAISPSLTLYTVLPLPAIIFLLIRTGKMIQGRYTAVQESFDAISSHTQESFSGVRVVKSFVQEQHERDRFAELCSNYVTSNLRLVRVWGLLFPTITLLASLSLGLLLYFGGKAVILNQLSIGQFVSFSFYINLLVWPMIATGWVFNMLQRGIASAKRVVALLSTPPDVIVNPKASITPPLKGVLEFRSLSFRYTPDSNDVLNDIDLTIPQGSSLGIMGKPGSGKTTLISLLFHLYPIKRGMLFLDHTDINDIPLSTLRSSIRYVPQESFLFSDTIEENIAFGSKNQLSKDRIEQVARLASIHDDVLRFPDSYSTKIGERGITLSGGQKQRLALARALLEPTAILVLDDALSAVDAATERDIWENISGEFQQRTTLVIAHRISSVKNCDTIIVLSNGSITECGSHESLLDQDGFYARLYHLQQMKGMTA